MARWHGLWMTPAHAPDFERELNTERLITISRNQPVSAAAHSLSSIVLAVTYFDLAPITLTTFTAVIHILAIAQFWVWFRHRRRARPAQASERTMNRIVASSVFWGALWGAFSAILLTITPLSGRSPICIITVGMAAGGLNMLASLPAAFLALSMVPSAVVTAVSPHPFGNVITVALIMCAIFLALTARRNYLAFLEHLRLRLGIARLADDAESASRAKSRFLANMSHELRTPLNAIIGFAEMIHEQVKGPIATHYAEFARAIDQSGRHLVDIINDILDLSKIQAGGHDLDESASSITAIVDRAVVVMNPMCQSAGMKLYIDLAPDLPSVFADARRLTQVLINLLSNAVKFSARGETVTLCAFMGPAQDGDPPPIVIEIADHGIGIPADELKEVLKPFVQSREAERRQTPGTGLGLPLADEIMRMHGGSLELDSAPGRGTTVTIMLPGSRALANGQPLASNREIAG